MAQGSPADRAPRNPKIRPVGGSKRNCRHGLQKFSFSQHSERRVRDPAYDRCILRCCSRVPSPASRLCIQSANCRLDCPSLTRGCPLATLRGHGQAGSRSRLGRAAGRGSCRLGESSAPAAQTPVNPDASAAAPETERVQRVALNRIRPCPFQPRKDFPEEALRELTDSIREQGIVQPLIVRARGEGFEPDCGRAEVACRTARGLAHVPVLVREADDTAALELALIENLQRENLNPLEEAQGYRQLLDQFHLRQEDIASKVGKSRVAVANALRLLNLPSEVQAHLRSGRLSVGHAKVILGSAPAGGADAGVRTGHPKWPERAPDGGPGGGARTRRDRC